MNPNDYTYICDKNVLVCPDCTSSDGISAFIFRHGAIGKCSYCNSDEEPVCSIDPVIAHILECIEEEYDHPDMAGIPYISKEGGYLRPVYTTWDILYWELAEPFLNVVCQAIQCDSWSEKIPYAEPWNKTLEYTWDKFRNLIMKQARFVFLNVKHPDHDDRWHDELAPVNILEILSEIINKIGLIRTFDAATRLYRIRIVDEDDDLSSAKELGAPPFESASMPNRMSPAGISMFYGAFDLYTAIAETYSRKKDKDKQLLSDEQLKIIYGTPNIQEMLDADEGADEQEMAKEVKSKKIVCAEFITTRPLTVIDLSQFGGVPCFFDPDLFKQRQDYIFLHNFIEDIRRPVTRDDRAHVEYVPTQVVTEYMRYLFRTVDDKGIDGLIWPSSRNRKQSIVLFADNNQCVEKKENYHSTEILALDVVRVITAKDII